MATIKKSGLGVSAVVLILSACAGQVFAQGVGNLGSLPSQIPHNGINGWDVVNPSGGALPVVRDPLGPVWRKNLLAPPGGVINGGQTYTLHEFLITSGTLSWSDWHEQILTPGWSFANVVLGVNGWGTPAGFSVVNTPGNALQGGSVSFYFNPIPPNTFVQIQKTLVYNGPVPATFSSIAIDQYPTPEPATMSLLALGGAAVMRRRNRNRTA